MLPSVLRRRPSAALVVALVALFVAVGGPAQAARLIGTGDIKDRSLKVKDLSRKAVKTLRTTPRRSVGEQQLRDGGVTTGKLRDSAITPVKIAPSAVGSAQLAEDAVSARELRPGAVTGVEVADGALDARDTARYAGRFRVTVPKVVHGTCWSGEPVGLAPEQAGADISGDLMLVTPDAAWPERQLAFTVRGSATRSRFVLAGCNVTGTDTDEVEVGFRYVVIDLP